MILATTFYFSFLESPLLLLRKVLWDLEVEVVQSRPWLPSPTLEKKKKSTLLFCLSYLKLYLPAISLMVTFKVFS
jgi:hypothetical protein